MRGIHRVLVVLLLAITGAVVGAAPASADANDFRFAGYDVVYELGRDDEGHSTLTTTETFVAVFPESDQNRGMQRAIPTRYEGHPTGLELVSVTDGNGAARPVDTDTDDGFLVVTSAADDFVHGEQTYVFTYTQRNVTLPAAETESGQDEFYWDTNGLGWEQPFDRYSIQVVASRDSGDLGAELTGESACYRGAEGSRQECAIEQPSSDPAQFTPPVALAVASGTDLGPGENVTIALGFEPGTFVSRDSSYFGSVFGILQLFSFAVALAALITAIVLRSTRLRDARGRATVIAEYAPPAASLFTSAQVLGRTAKATAAAFVDLAVRGVLRIEEHTETGLLGREKEHYVLRLVDPTPAPTRFVRPRDLSTDEHEFLTLIFGPSLTPGTERDLSDKDTAFGTALTTFMSALPKRTTEAGLRSRASVAPSVWTIIASVVGMIATIVFGVLLLVDDRGGVLPLVLLISSFVFVFAVFFLVLKTPLTAAGAELRDHLRGLELYIRLAEADRMRMLQSPEGAERDENVVELTERLLPYAVLFGQEKEWAQVLAVAYEQGGADPSWYAGSSGFNAALFAGSVSSFSATTASSWSGSASSSSSGGASGGGSSGGGGGGGGGGGV